MFHREYLNMRLLLLLYMISTLESLCCGKYIYHDLPPHVSTHGHGDSFRINIRQTKEIERLKRFAPNEFKNNHETFKSKYDWSWGNVKTFKHIAEFTQANGTTRYVQAYITIAPDPLNQFSIYEPGGEGGCKKTSRILRKTSDTAKNLTAHGKHCIVAGNAGFFNMTTGACLGNTVSDGRVVQVTERQNANFGILKDGTFVTGYVSQEMANSTNKPFKQLIAGVIWIIRNGKVYVNQSKAIEDLETETTPDFITTLSARSAIGHDKYGRLIVVQVEGKTFSRGVNLFDLAQIMINFGAINAINLDGGGSMTSVRDDVVQSMPSDKCWRENKYQCEREVATIVCVHHRYCEPDPLCSNNGHCHFSKCVCRSGWYGNSCEKQVNSCKDPRGNFCHAKADCIPTGPGIHKCVCHHGYYGNGTHCDDIDECMLLNTSTKSNNKTETNQPLAEYHDGEEIKKVSNHVVHDPWAAMWQSKQPLQSQVTFMTYTNSVHPDPCSAYSHCTNTKGSYRCDQDANNTCNGNITVLCSKNARCIATGPGSHICVCLPGYAGDGKVCTDISGCALLADQHNDADDDKTLLAVVPEDTVIQPTVSHIPCHNDAIWVEINGTFVCQCAKGFVGNGINCDTIEKIGQQYLHTWAGTEKYILPMVFGMGTCAILLVFSLVTNFILLVKLRRSENRASCLSPNSNSNYELEELRGDDRGGNEDSMEELCPSPRPPTQIIAYQSADAIDAEGSASTLTLDECSIRIRVVPSSPIDAVQTPTQSAVMREDPDEIRPL